MDSNNAPENNADSSNPADPIITMEPVIKKSGRRALKSVIDPGDSLNGLGFIFSFIPFFCYPAFIVSSIGVKRSRKGGYKGVLGIFGMIISGFWLFIVPFTVLFIVSTTPVDKIVPAPVIQGLAQAASSNPALSGVLNNLAGNPTSTVEGVDNSADCQKIVDAVTAVSSGQDPAIILSTLTEISTTSQDPEMINKINNVTSMLTTGGDVSASLTDLAMYCSSSVTSIQ